MDKSNNQKVILKASPQKKNLFASLQKQINQSDEQLELGFIILVPSPDSRKNICCFLPMQKTGWSNIKLKWLNNIAGTVCHQSTIAIYCTDIAASGCL